MEERSVIEIAFRTVMKKLRSKSGVWQPILLYDIAIGYLVEESWNRILQRIMIRSNRNAEIKSRIAKRKG